MLINSALITTVKSGMCITATLADSTQVRLFLDLNGSASARFQTAVLDSGAYETRIGQDGKPFAFGFANVELLKQLVAAQNPKVTPVEAADLGKKGYLPTAWVKVADAAGLLALVQTRTGDTESDKAIAAAKLAAVLERATVAARAAQSVVAAI